MESLPILGISAKKEAIVAITENIIKDRRVVYDTSGDTLKFDSLATLGEWEQYGSIYSNQEISTESLTFDKIKQYISSLYAGVEQAKLIDQMQRQSNNILRDPANKAAIGEFIDNCLEENKRILDNYSPIDLLQSFSQAILSEYNSNDLSYNDFKEYVIERISERPVFSKNIDRQQLSGDDRILSGYMDNYRSKALTKEIESGVSSAAQKYRKLEKLMEAQAVPCPISDKALMYYTKRAELIKEQLSDNGYNDIGDMEEGRLRQIPASMFGVSKESIMEALSKDESYQEASTKVPLAAAHLFPDEEKQKSPAYTRA